jgi:PAS domain S-box-containing protein
VTEKRSNPDDSANLRKRAEEKFRSDAAAAGATTRKSPSPGETQQALHELRVHQIELEMQNEELRRAQVDLEALRSRYFDLYDLAPVSYFTLSEKGLIMEANLTAAELLGMAKTTLVKHPFTRFILPGDQDIYHKHRKRLFETGAPQGCELRLLKKDGARLWAWLEATVARNAGEAPVCRLMASDITLRKQAEEALQKAFDQIKTLRGIVPICASCKMIRVDKGYWNHVESYVSDHTEAQFSHGICPECKKKLYPELEKDHWKAPKKSGALQ